MSSGGDSYRGKFREWMGKGWFCREMGSPALDLRPQDGAGVRMASCPQSILNVTRSQSYDPNTICDNHTPCGNPEFRFLFYSPKTPSPNSCPSSRAREQCAQGAIAEVLGTAQVYLVV